MFQNWCFFYFRHFWLPEVSQGWRTQNPRRSSQLETRLGQRAGSSHILDVNLERLIWTTLSTSLVNIRSSLRLLALNVLCSGGNTEILKFNPHSNNTWTLYDQMTEKAGSKLEISTINCRTVHNYWPKSQWEISDVFGYVIRILFCTTGFWNKFICTYFLPFLYLNLGKDMTRL